MSAARTVRRRDAPAPPSRGRPAGRSPAGASPGPLARLDAALESRGTAIVAAAIALYAITYLACCAIKLRFYLYKDIDLPIFAQALDRLLHGTTFDSIRGMSWLGDHSSLILVPLAPLWAIAPHPMTPLAVQTIALALGAWPVYRIARRALPAGSLPVVAALLYLIYPAVGYLNLFEFHPEALATPALLAMLDAFLAARLGATLAWAAIALLCREDVALPVLGVALLSLGPGRARRAAFAGGLAALALGSLALTFMWLKPVFNAGQAEYGRMYAVWGATPGAMLARLATHPLDALSALWNTPGNPVDTLIKRQLWIHLLLPVTLLPLAAPALLLPAIPVLFEHLLSERRHQHTIVFQYAALTIPFFVSAAVLGLARAAAWLGASAATRSGRTRAASLALVVIVVAIGTNVLFGPLLGREIFQRAPRNESVLPGDYDVTLRPFRERMLARVPRDGGVVAGFEFLPGLARHAQLHSIHHVISGRYTYSERPYPMPGDVRALLADLAAQAPNLRLDSGSRLRALVAANDLHPVDAAGSTLLFLRGARDTIELMRFEPSGDRAVQSVIDGQIEFLGADPPPERAVAGGTLVLRARWRRVGPVTRTFLSSVHLFPDDDHSNAVEVRNRPIGYGLLPAADWPADSVLVETVHLELSTRLVPGRYRVAMTALALDSLGRTVGSRLELRVPVRNQQLVEVGSFELVRGAR